MNIETQRKIGSILIPSADVSLEHELLLHIVKKNLFHDLCNGGAQFEEVLEALEVFIGTSNMDDYLLDIKQPLNQLCDFYGVPD